MSWRNMRKTLSKKERPMRICYRKEFSNIFIRWERKDQHYDVSEDYGGFILDFDQNGEVIGIEILDLAETKQKDNCHKKTKS